MTDSHEWSRGKALYILGSLEPVRITLLAQQTRALNLVYALACEGYLKAGTRIAVLGAGPAGLTAAQAAAHLGAEVQVFEQAAQPFSIFCPNGTGNNRRYVHPNLESWPEEGWSEPDAKLPFLNWSAGTPAEVIASYIKGLTKTSIGAAKERLKIFCSVQARIHPNAGRNWRSDGLNWRVEFRAKDWEWNQWNKQDPRPPVGGRWDAEILLLAIGFGEDGVNTTSSDESLPYWSSDAKLWARIEKVRHPKAVLVSGGGDGALIDAVNAALHAKDNPFPHRQLLERLRGLILTPSLRRGLIAIEQAIRKKRWSNELLWREYQELQVQHASQIYLKAKRDLAITSAEIPQLCQLSIRLQRRSHR